MFHNTSAINGRTTPVLRFENLLNLPPLPLTKLFFQKKKGQKRKQQKHGRPYRSGISPKGWRSHYARAGAGRH